MPSPASTAGEEQRGKAGGSYTVRGVATRARLVRAAKAVFEEDGFLDARISDIVERAGMSYGSFYYYFDSKMQIFREVARSIGDLLQQPMYTLAFTATATATASPAEAVRRLIRQFLAAYRGEARIIGVIEMVARYDSELAGIQFEYLEAGHVPIARAVRRMQPRGWADPSSNLDVALLGISAMMNRFAEMWFVQELFELDFDDGVEQLVRLCLNALRLEEPADASCPGPAGSAWSLP
jgi:AcrR family transcriptional regulator